MTVIVGIDLGSRRCGCVAGVAALPFEVLVAETVEIAPPPKFHRLDLTPTLDALVARVEACGASELAIEHGVFYAPEDRSPGAVAKMAQNHAATSILEAGLYRVLTDQRESAIEIATWAGLLPSSTIRVSTIARNSWTHRVLPRTSGAITEEQANDALRGHLTPGSWERLKTQDERDAVGAIVGHLLGATPGQAKKSGARKRPAAPRAVGPKLPPEQRGEKIRAQTRERVRRHRAPAAAAKVAAGCLCFVARAHGGGSHKRGCPLAPAPRVRSSVAAAAASGSSLKR